MSDVRYFAGIDIGGTNIKYGIINDSGEVLYRKQQPTMAEKGPDALMHLITNIGETLLYQAAEDELEIKHIGVGTPGAVDIKTGKVIGPCPNIQGWVGTEIGANLADRLNVPIFVENDVHAMAVGESLFGAARNTQSVVCVTVGTGVGGAIMIDGKIVNGFNSSAGELGHMTINYDGPQCTCGNQGCLEVYCSSRAMIARTKELLDNEMTQIFKDILDSSIDNLTIKKIFQSAKRSDPVAIDVLKTTARYLGIGLAGIMNILNPEILVIGGGITDGGARFTQMVEENIKELAFDSAVEKLKVVKAALGNDAGFMGAAMLGEING